MSYSASNSLLASPIWDYCQGLVDGSEGGQPWPDLDGLKALNSYSSVFHHQILPPLPADATGESSSASNAISGVGDKDNKLGRQNSQAPGLDGLHSALVDAEATCQTFIADLDDTLRMANNITDTYNQISSRTNALIMNCESLLEQQESLKSTAESLRQLLSPYSDLEDIASKLGIPLETFASAPIASGSSIAGSGALSGLHRADSGTSLASANINMSEHKWKDFEQLLVKLTNAASFIRAHPEYYESEKYFKIVDKLQIRATSIVAKNIKDHLDSAAAVCRELLSKNAAKNIKWNLDEMPLESSVIYQRFRSLSFRLKDLNNLLVWNCHHNSGDFQKRPKSPTHNRLTGVNKSNSNGNLLESSRPPDFHIIEDVMKMYIGVRAELLLPIIRDNTHILISKINRPKVASTNNAARGANNEPTFETPLAESNGLCPCIRQSFMLLIRLAQLEHQLFESLFNDAVSGKNGDGNQSNEISVYKDGSQVLSIIQLICQGTHDSLRPLLIHESDIDELCKIISVLAEDIRTQIVAMTHLSKPIIQLLLGILESTTSDAQERLVYLAETKMRIEVQMFEPLPSHLQYPETLANFQNSSIKTIASGSQSESEINDSLQADDISKTWYPPLKTTLSLLSKLYGVIEMTVFEDFANRVVQYCIAAIMQGTEKVRKLRTVLHSDLFLLRHLLILREQLSPFEIRLLSIEKKLDFRPTSHVFSHILASTSGGSKGFGSHGHSDVSNMMVSLIVEGLPSMEELKTDTKAELDKLLKNTCVSLKQDTIKAILAPLENFLAKVVAFAGEIPVCLDDGRVVVGNTIANANEFEARGDDKHALLSADTRSKLKKENFMKFERIQEVVTNLQQVSAQATPDFRDMLKLYIENSVARAVFLKPIQQEIDFTKRRLLCVVQSCFETGDHRTSLEQQLESTIFTILSELSR